MLRVVLWIEESLLVLSLIVLMGMAVFQILLRDFFSSGIFWADSFLRVLVLWVAMLGAMVATRERRHISIDLLSRFLSPVAQRTIARVVDISSSAACALAAWYCAVFVRLEMEGSSNAFGSVPNWVCELILPIGFGVMGLRFLIFTVVGAEAREGE